MRYLINRKLIATRITREYTHGLKRRNKIADKITKSVALVRERTIPTEQPPIVGEVIANI
jgi:hypothetical protein